LTSFIHVLFIFNSVHEIAALSISFNYFSFVA
jgi:hypothetical protein